MCCFIIIIVLFLLLLLLFVFGGNQSLLAFNFNIISSSKSRTVQMHTHTHQLKIDSVVHMNNSLSLHALHIDAISTVRSCGMSLFALVFVSSFLLFALSICFAVDLLFIFLLLYGSAFICIYPRSIFLKSETYPHGANYNTKIK